MKRAGLIVDPIFEEHDTGPSHPERPARAATLRTLLERDWLGRCESHPLVAATDEQLHRVHDPAYVESVREICESGGMVLDSMDTAVCRASEKIARLAAGSLASLCVAVAEGRLERAFAVVRPPGHHAERDRAMGFCIFNNVAVAARELTAVCGLSRVMILDWDVHHGNGTQHIFEEDCDVFYFSCHQSPLYPGTGAADERGRGEGQGSTLNVPLAPGSGDAAFLASISDGWRVAAEFFKPEMILISAGFDAHVRDPLANLEVSTEAYAEATDIVCEVADRYSSGRVVSVLEGGYDLQALEEGATAHLERLFESD
jgi:acetoin utilization deacetylase AcuC-like enzyme